jgi:hypothetical protein
MTIDLSDEEALVLYDLLACYGTNDQGRNLAIRNAAERNALWSLQCQLEKKLVAPFRHDYDELLALARQRVEDEGGPW